MFCRRRLCRNIQNGDITAEEFRRKIAQGAVLLDVRSRQEYQKELKELENLEKKDLKLKEN